MKTALDVAAYILSKQGTMTAMKLQKLVYYAQAWPLVWDEKPLFREKIEAWGTAPWCAAYLMHTEASSKFQPCRMAMASV